MSAPSRPASLSNCSTSTRVWLSEDAGSACRSPIRTRTPRLNGKVERSHRVDDQEFSQLLDKDGIGDIHLFNEKLREWEDYYNYLARMGVWSDPVRATSGKDKS